ncbi:MAG: hypothetical protein IJ342_04470 [Muribaculaceae bacterium]|nr:hypothetical protein [Muribaculaceae bacterium]
MKRIFITGFCLLVACVGIMAVPIAKDLNEGNKLSLNLELEFPEDAKEENAFISWELVGDWDKFDYCFSQGRLENNIFTIDAVSYKEFFDGENGIALIITGKPETEDATYNLSMKVLNVSDDLDFPKEELDLNLSVHYILPPPPPLWERLLVPAIILVVLILIVWIVLKVTAKFPDGLLQLGREEINIKGKSRISVKEELEKLGITLEDDCDVILVKKRFTSFQGPCFAEIRNCALERDGVFVSKGMVLLPEEELSGLKDINGNEIIIRYC